MIYLASDHGGFVYKEKIKKYLDKSGIKFQDFGTNSASRCDAIDYCVPATMQVVKSALNKGIFICRSGHAMSIIANRFPGARAVCSYDVKATKSARLHNNINVLCVGADYVSFGKFKKLVKAFLETEFLGGVYKKRLDKLNKLKV